MDYKELFSQVVTNLKSQYNNQAACNLFVTVDMEEITDEYMERATLYASLFDGYKGTYDVDKLIMSLEHAEDIPNDMDAGDHWVVKVPGYKWQHGPTREALSGFFIRARMKKISFTIVTNYGYMKNYSGIDKDGCALLPGYLVFTSSIVVVLQSTRSIVARHIKLPTATEIEFK